MKLNKVLVSAAALSGIAAAGTAANADTVSVKTGDTVSELAQKFNTTVEAIQKANNLQNVNFITVGEQLNIPTNDNAEQQVQQPQANAAQVQQEQAAIAQQQAAQRQAQLAAQQKAAQAQAALQAQQAAQAAAAQKQAEEQAAQQAAAQKAQQEAAAAQAAKEQQEKAEQAAQAQAAANAKAAQQRATQQAQAQQQQQKQQVVQQNTQQQAANNNQQSNNNNNNSNSSEAAAKAWIVDHESGGNYNARNGQYIGAYQLSASYLNGDYSQANQDRVANQYVASRYGNWVNAQKHWEQCGWY